MVNLTSALQAHCVDAAASCRWHGQREIWLPARIVEVILVEVDSAILARGLTVSGLFGRPIMACDCTGGHIDSLAMPSVLASVGYVRGRMVQRKVPGGDRTAAARFRGRCALTQFVDFSDCQCSIEDAGAIDLAIEEPVGRLSRGSRSLQSGCGQ